MPAFNFQKRFAEKVESGEKKQTIRARRKDGRNPRVGQTAYLYFGMRTKSCRKLGEDIITSVEPITIERNGPAFVNVTTYRGYLGYFEKEVLANEDGFSTFTEMLEWFETTHSLPFYGFLIKWRG